MTDAVQNDDAAVRPRVSVVIPTRNRPHLLAEALRSVAGQTIRDYEVVIVVNGPINAFTPQIMDVAAGHRIIRIEREGIAVALNAGIEAARGEWIAFLDDDDLWEPNRLEAALKTGDETDADLIFCDSVVFDEFGGFFGPKLRPPPNTSTKEALTLRSFSGCSAAFARRSAVLAVGGFDPTMVGPDWDLWMRLGWRFKVAWTEEYLVWLRQHRHNSGLSWVSTSLEIQRKALRTMPAELRHMRPRIIWEMIRVMKKGAETRFRRKWLSRVRGAKPRPPNSNLTFPLNRKTAG